MSRPSTHPGTPRLFADRFPTPSGRARFHAVAHQPPAEDRDSDYPLYLTTGRVLAQYQSGTQTRRVAALQALAPEPIAELHPLTARRLGVRDDGFVTLDHAPRCGPLQSEADDERPRGHGLRAVSLGRGPVDQPSHPCGAGSREPHARVQGLRGARRVVLMTRRRLVVIGNGMAGARFVDDLLARMARIGST